MNGGPVDEIRYLWNEERLTLLWLAGNLLGFLVAAVLITVA
ncbi:MAG TPA: hypothetical protein VFX97_20665 [Pyrinomonadaceae bacterium]|nr:hypothetical protein [Pyrinomonadaceae bacterium]